jgi:hypothetical protein
MDFGLFAVALGCSDVGWPLVTYEWLPSLRTVVSNKNALRGCDLVVCQS